MKNIKILNNKIIHIKKDWGIFFTPKWVVDFMVGLIDEKKLNMHDLKILEPACGMCQFLRGIKENKNHIFSMATRLGVEMNEDVINYVRENNLNDGIEIIHHDYLLWNTDSNFDIIIGNPPYGIPSLSSHYAIKIDNKTKKLYKQLYETWYGKYNIYGAFVEKSIKLLKDNAQLIFIVPATFMLLDEFKKLREFLARNGESEIIYMGSNVFKPEADVTTVVLKFVKSLNKKNKVMLYDYKNGKLELISKNENWNGNVVLFSTKFSRMIDEICNFRVGDVYDIKISPRTTEIKHSHDVIRYRLETNSKRVLPILNGRNLKIGMVIYKPISGYWIEDTKKTKLRRFFDKPHIVVGLSFRKNKHIAVAYDYKGYPWMGDVYHLLKKDNIDFNLNEDEVVSFLNSEIIRKYIKDVFRDITYHLNITQIKMLPLIFTKKAKNY